MVPVQVSNLDSVTSIVGCGNSGYALKKDGTVWAWGNNQYGQLGNNSTIESHVPVQVDNLSNVTNIAGGANNGYALKSDGTVWSWGNNNFGQLGNKKLANASIYRSLVPVQVTDLTAGINKIPVKTIDNNSSDITYTGTWTHSTDANYYNSTKSVSTTVNSAAQLTFTGSAIRVYACKKPGVGMVDVYIDGVKDTTVDMYNKTDIYKVKIYEKTGLAAKTHTIKLILSSQKNAASTGTVIGFDYFEYDTAEMAKVESPTFSPSSGVYTAPITISCATVGATIKYTTDGSTPSAASVTYTGPITLTANTTIKAYAYKAGMTDSDVTSTSYTVPSKTVTTVDNNNSSITYTGTWTHSSDANYCNSTKSVSTTANSAAQLTFTGSAIRVYTCKKPGVGMVDVYIDGIKDATVDMYNSSDIYKVKIYEKTGLTSGTHSIKLVLSSQKNAASTGTVIGFDYFEYDASVQDKTVSNPTFNPASGTYTTAQAVTISCATNGAIIKYTTDSALLNSESATYTAPIIVNANTIIRAYAYKIGMTDSEKVGAEYIIKDENTHTYYFGIVDKFAQNVGPNLDNGVTLYKMDGTKVSYIFENASDASSIATDGKSATILGSGIASCSQLGQGDLLQYELTSSGKIKTKSLIKADNLPNNGFVYKIGTAAPSNNLITIGNQSGIISGNTVIFNIAPLLAGGDVNVLPYSAIYGKNMTYSVIFNQGNAVAICINDSNIYIPRSGVVLETGIDADGKTVTINENGTIHTYKSGLGSSPTEEDQLWSKLTYGTYIEFKLDLGNKFMGLATKTTNTVISTSSAAYISTFNISSSQSQASQIFRIIGIDRSNKILRVQRLKTDRTYLADGTDFYVRYDNYNLNVYVVTDKDNLFSNASIKDISSVSSGDYVWLGGANGTNFDFSVLLKLNVNDITVDGAH